MITKKTCTSYGILYLTSLDLKIYSKYSKSKLSLLIVFPHFSSSMYFSVTGSL